MSFKEYANFDGLGLAKLVRDKQVKSSELVDEAISRIERHNTVLNAVIHKSFDIARAATKDTDSGDASGPFSGVPFLLKDIGALCEGLPSRMGSKFLKDFIAPFDDELVRRYKQSGVAILGKTNAPELGLVPTTESDLYGPAHNPWNLNHSTGGSSGGSAAAVAAGILPMAHANDGGGSIRIPASCCGVVGLKPTRARITAGPMMGEILGGLPNDHIVCRTMRDCAAMLDATAGPMPGDPYVAPPPKGTFLEAAEQEPGQLRIAYCDTDFDGQPIHNEVAEGVRKTAKVLESLGHHVVAAYPQGLVERTTDPFVTLWAVGATTTLDGLAPFVGRPVTESDVEPLTWYFYEHGKQVSAPEYIAAWDTIYAVAREVGNFFEEYDVLLTPTLSKPPLALGEIDTSHPDPATMFRSLIDYANYTPVFNATGQPAISLPLHMSEDGLPIGIQLCGRYGDEETLLSLGGQLEQVMPWADRHPIIWD